MLNFFQIKATRSLMFMTKKIVSLPLFTMTPTAFLTSTQWILYGDVPLWLKRAFCSFYYVPASANPWVAIYTLKPFWKQFLKLLSRITQRFTLAGETKLWAVKSVHQSTDIQFHQKWMGKNSDCLRLLATPRASACIGETEYVCTTVHFTLD